MLIIGLTGGIGMGKTTTAAMFAATGVVAHDADRVVHRLYAFGGDGVAAIGRIAPAAVVGGAVDRAALSRAIATDPSLLQRIERAIHPLVRREETRCVGAARRAGRRALLLDVPLLFETGADRRCDLVVVVSAPVRVQRRRVLARPGMSRGKLRLILARQMPDAQRRARADVVVPTGLGLHHARRAVLRILARLGVG